jgi:hypothetical protein
MTATKRVASIDLDLLHSTFADRMTDVPCIALASVIVEKLRQQGIKLSKAECRELLDLIRKDPLSFSLPPGRNGRLLNCDIRLDLQDLVLVEKEVDLAEIEAPQIFEQMAEDGAIRILNSLKKCWPKTRREQRREVAAFEKRLYLKWAGPLDIMQHFFTITAELLASFRERIDSDGTKLNLWELLTRLLARGLRTAEEIHCLLRSGFADSALSRWRTLHEIAVTSHFMIIHGEEAATRYLDHQWIESKKRMEELSAPLWAECADAGFIKEKGRIDTECAVLIAKYGKAFRNDYGWAAHHMGMDKPNFREIEKSVSADHYRAHYQLASANVHAGSKGTYAPLPDGAPMLLLGPSDSGLASPGQATIHVLLEIVEDVVQLYPSLDAVITYKILQSLTGELDEAFEECEANLKHAHKDLAEMRVD